MNGATLTLIGLGCALAFAAVQYGGVLPQHWNPCLLAIALVSGVFWLRSQRRGPSLPPMLRWSIVSLLVLACAQVAPLDPAIAGWLSAPRGDAAEALRNVGIEPGLITLSALPSATLPHLFRALACVLVLLTVRELAWRSRRRPWDVCYPLIAVAAAEGGLGAVQSLYLQNGVGAPGTFVNRNHFAGLLEICLPFAVMLAVSSFQRRDTPLRYWGPSFLAGAAASGLILAGIFASLSRAGFGIALCTLALLGLATFLHGRTAPWRWTKLRVASATAAAAVVLAALVTLPSAALLGRFANLTDSGELDIAFRAGLWKDALAVFAAYHVFGCGLGAFRSAFSLYKTGAPNYDVDYAHNDYLQLLAELGLVGAALVAVIAIGVLLFLFQRLRQAEGPGSLGVPLACLASLTAIALHSIVDFNLYIPSNAMAVAWTLGIALRPRNGRRSGVVSSCDPICLVAPDPLEEQCP